MNYIVIGLIALYLLMGFCLVSWVIAKSPQAHNDSDSEQLFKLFFGTFVWPIVLFLAAGTIYVRWLKNYSKAVK